MSTFAAVAEQFPGSGDLPEAQREAIDALAALAEAKSALFVAQRVAEAGTGRLHGLPINQIIRRTTVNRAFTPASAVDIPGDVTAAVTEALDIDSGALFDAICADASSRLERFLGEATGGSSSVEAYFLYPADFAIYLLDLDAWARSVSAQSLQTAMRQAIACTLVTLSVDARQISWDALNATFSAQLEAMDDLTPEQRTAAKAQMRETWNFLNGE